MPGGIMPRISNYQPGETSRERNAYAKYWWNEILTQKERTYYERISVRLTGRALRMGPYGLAEVLLALAALVEEQEDGIVERTDNEKEAV